MDTQDINIPTIHLEWSEWSSWNELMEDARSGGIRIPNGKPGVYEARLKNNIERLTIGKASDLRMRIRQGLIKGKTQHSSGKRIRSNEDINNIEIRWAETDRPSATEEELHRQYLARFGKWPKYTEHT
jgi:excinuclease UvrABC nuclease subunit